MYVLPQYGASVEALRVMEAPVQQIILNVIVEESCFFEVLLPVSILF